MGNFGGMNIRRTMLESPQSLPSVSSCPVLVLAGGLGTRLRAAYDDGPKCLAPVAGRPFLEYLLMWLHAAGIRELILCVGHKRAQVQHWLRDGRHGGLNVRYCVEKELLGTAGALRLASTMVEAQTCLALNGDSFLDVNLQEMYRFHQSRRALATLALARVRDSGRYGGIQLDRQGRIKAFSEKRGGCKQPSGEKDAVQLINGGVYLLERQFFGSIPEGRAVSLETESFPALTGGDIYGFVSSGYFIDIGVPADYARAQKELAERFSYDYSS